MRKDFLIKVEGSTSFVYLNKRIAGINRENLQGNFIVKFLDEFVDGIAWMEYDDGTNRGYLAMTKVGEAYTLPILSSMLSKVGQIRLQVRITEDENANGIPVWKSNIFNIEVREALNTTTTIPDEYPEWIDVANEKIAEMDNIDIDITTEGDNTKVVITRKDGTEKEAIVSGGGAVTDVQKNGVSVVVDGVANVTVPTNTSDLNNNSNFVADANYVHTDNNYTTTEKNKLAGLSNYDDTEIRGLINEVADDIPTDTSDLTNGAGFITDYTETDPVFSSSPAGGITSNDISNWNGKQDKLTSANAGNNVTITEVGGVVKINSSGGGGGTSDYADLSNKPQINDVALIGNKSLADLGIQPAGHYLTSETDPVFSASASAGITSSDISNWNNKSDFSGNYDDLSNKPTIPDELSDLSDDSTHRLVTDTEKSTWNNKSDFSGSYNDLTNKPTIPNQLNVQVNGNSIVSNDVANLLTKTAYDAETNKLATESDLFSGDYDDLADKPKLNNIPISGNKTPQMYGLQPAGNYVENPTITTNQVNATYTFTLNNNTEYRNTIDMTSITLNLPSTIDTDYCSWLVFPSGSTATSLTYPNTILWSGDDVSNNTFVPVSDKTYNVCFWYDSVNVNAVVRGV